MLEDILEGRERTSITQDGSNRLNGKILTTDGLERSYESSEK